MAFADLASNQMVDENNASTGGFTAIGPKNPGNQCYTKAQALAAYQLNASLMNDYADNRLVPKGVWGPASIAVYHYYVSSYSQTASSIVCSTPNTGADVIFLYANTTPNVVVGQTLYIDTSLTIPFNGSSLYWPWLLGDAIVPGTTSAYSYKISSVGVIEEIVGCPSGVFVPYNYVTNLKCYPNGGGTYIFEVEIDVYGAPTWNSITGGTIQVTQNSSNNTNGIKNILFIGGTKYQCQSVATFNSGSSVSMTYCSISVSNGSTSHTHSFTVPVNFNVGEINAATTKTTTVNVT
jgi:hypothetical protein